MTKISAISSPSSRQPSESGLRLALVHDGHQDLTALVSILSDAELRPIAGVFPLERIGEVAAHLPEGIVVAVAFNRSQGVTAVRWLRRHVPHAPIVAIARDAPSTAAREALNAGAQALVPEERAAGALAPAVRAVLAGLVCAPSGARRGIAKPTFTTRERQILALLVLGMTNQQIAARLWLAESTVKTHVASAFSKLGVRSRKDAVDVILDPAEGLRAVALPPEVSSHHS